MGELRPTWRRTDCQVGLFRPNFKNLASFHVGWPKNYIWLFGLISSWTFGSFYAEIGFSLRIININVPFFRQHI